MVIKNILVPIDFSECSKNALKIAIKLAKQFDSKIYMVNAVHVHTPHPDIIGGKMIDAIIMDYESQVQESFQELEKDVIELQDVPHEADRFLAYLTDAIYTECASKNIDLIVMGTREKHSDIEHLIGSRSTDIIEFSKVPVLTIPESFKEFKLKKMGFASDLSEIKNYRKLELLNLIASSFKAEVMVFAVVDDPAKLTVKHQKLMEELSGKFTGTVCSARTVQSDSVSQGIVNFAQAHELDLLAMVPRERSFFQRIFTKSKTKHIALDIKIPLLTFHE